MTAPLERIESASAPARVTISLTAETAAWLLLNMGARDASERESGEVWEELRRALFSVLSSGEEGTR